MMLRLSKCLESISLLETNMMAIRYLLQLNVSSIKRLYLVYDSNDNAPVSDSQKVALTKFISINTQLEWMDVELGDVDGTDFPFIPTNHPVISKLKIVCQHTQMYYLCNEYPHNLFNKLKTLPSIQSLHFHFAESWEVEAGNHISFYDGLIELLQQQHLAGSPITELSLDYPRHDVPQEIRFLRYLFQSQPLVDHLDYRLNGLNGIPIEFAPVIKCKVNKLVLKGRIIQKKFQGDEEEERRMIQIYQSLNNVDKIIIIGHNSFEFISGLLRYNKQSSSITIKHFGTNQNQVPQMIIDAIQDNPHLNNVKFRLSPMLRDYSNFVRALQQHPNHQSLTTKLER
ncbi:hypothetical protein SAMD00019534_094950, partial [Acytostelium subglobosum LB1]|uniref:hypothetical protein n=1 Tax=Acytostelium subglobosum LB1 TaxID=1410327 RepID=UPI0006449000